ncbi:MAG: hypothetical protein L6Q66_07170, partial [Bacteroidia bacterium]|nr:hypothetical protein [Bacteroidia bacterium]
MKNQFNYFILAMIVAGSIFTGCKKDEDTVPTPPAPANEGEVLTTFTLYFTDSANAANIVSATFRDPDGDGGNPFTQ